MTSLDHALFLDVRTIAAIVAILLFTIVVAALIRRGIDRAMARAAQNGDHDSTGLVFVKRSLLAVVYLLGGSWALAQVPEFRTMGHSLLAGAGALTVITGLASQQVLGNVMSGILIVLFKPFRINDRITINGMTGTVEDINLREIVLRDVENNRIVIPNSMITSNALVNYQHTDTRVCKKLEIGVGYASDLDRAMAIMVEEAGRHPLRIDPRTPEQKAKGEPEVVVRVTALGDSAVTLTAWVWAKDVADAFVMHCDLLKSLKQRFDAAGVEIPFPQRTVSYAPGAPMPVAGRNV